MKKLKPLFERARDPDEISNFLNSHQNMCDVFPEGDPMANKKQPIVPGSQEDIESLARLPEESISPVFRLTPKGKTLYANKFTRNTPAIYNPKTKKIDASIVKKAKACHKSGERGFVDVEIDGKIYELVIISVDDFDYINVYGRDVTELRETVKRAEGLAKFPNENPNPVMRAKSDGVLLFCNKASEDIPGIIEEGPPMKMSAELTHLVRDAMRLHEIKSTNITSGDTTYLFTFSPVKGEEYANIYGRDVTAEIEAQEALVATNQLLEQRIAERTASVRLLQNIVLAANSAESFEAALQTALHEICLYTHWPVGHAYVVEHVDGHNELKPTGIWHIETSSELSDLRNATESLRFGQLDDLPGRVVAEGREVWVENLQTRKDFRRRKFTEKAGLVSAMAFPVTIHSQIIGVLEFFSQEVTPANVEIIKTLEHVGAQLGSVAERKNAEAEVQKAREEAELAHARMTDALEVINQGFVLFDKDDNIVLFNSNYAARVNKILGRDPVVGDNFETIIRASADVRYIPKSMKNTDEWVESILKERRETKVRDSINHQNDGTWFRAQGFETADGGTVSIFTDITELKQQEEAMAELARKSELAHNRLVDAVEAIGQGFVLFDDEDRFVLYNQKYLAMMNALEHDPKIGETFESVLRATRKSDFGELSRDEWIESMLKDRRDNPVRSAESYLAGQWFKTEGSLTAEGGIVSTFTDITEIKEKEEAVSELARKSELAHNRLLDAVEAIGQGFVLFDSEDRLVLHNKKYLEVMHAIGHDPKVGDRFEDFLHNTKKEDFGDQTREEWIEGILKDRRENPVRSSTAHLDGRWYKSEGSITGEGGIVSTFTDITELKEQEDALAEMARQSELAHSRLLDGIEALGQGFALFDEEDRYVMFNSQYSKMIEVLCRRPELGERFADVLRDTKRTDFKGLTKDEWMEEVLALRRSNEARNDTNSLPDGTWYKAEGFRTSDGGNVSVFTDITDLKQHEAELDALVNELGIARDAAVEANSAKSQFLANMSHELRTPLNAIIGYSELLIDDAEDDENEEYIPDLEKIQKAGKHLLGLINDILDLSKIEVGKIELFIEEFAVPTMLEEVQATILPLMDKNNNALELEIEDGLTPLKSDLTKIRQNLFNLLSNASKFSKDSTVSVKAYSEMDRGLEMVVFEVTDQGIGMTPQQLAKVFDPFTQADASTSKNFGGTGLGLTITREFCRMLGGDIEATSEEGVGTTFTMKILADGTRLTNENDEEDIIVGEPGSGPLVLIIDDDPHVRDLLRRNLDAAGYRTATAKDGKDGLKRAKEIKPDAITLDVLMPHTDGWTVLSELKGDRETGEIPVIMVTISEDKSLGFSLGASEFLSKPVDRKKLVSVLNRFITSDNKRPVLIVEDDAATRGVTRKYLEHEGLEVVEAENGKIGLKRLAEENPSLIFLDLMMPEIDGFGFIEEFRKHPEWHHIPVVVVTAKSLSTEEKKQLEGWVEALYSKLDTSIEDVLKEVSAFLPPPKQSS